MEKVVLTKQEFDRMPNYSHSLPSGTCLGKTWRCEADDGWYMGQYVPDPNAKVGRDGPPETVGIKWRKIEVENPNAQANTKPVTPVRGTGASGRGRKTYNLPGASQGFNSPRSYQ